MTLEQQAEKRIDAFAEAHKRWKAELAAIYPMVSLCWLTRAQLDAIRTVARHGGVLRRFNYGCYSYPGCPHEINARMGRKPIPIWHCNVGTIEALARRGLLARAQSIRDEWLLTVGGGS